MERLIKYSVISFITVLTISYIACSNTVETTSSKTTSTDGEVTTLVSNSESNEVTLTNINESSKPSLLIFVSSALTKTSPFLLTYLKISFFVLI